MGSHEVMLASIEFDLRREQGRINLESICYDVKHVCLSGQWSLELDGQVIAVAMKPNPRAGFFAVSDSRQSLVLRAESLLTRAFLIEQDDRLLGTIKPQHLFTKRASIDCSSSIAIPVQIFLFWLTVLMWKRSEDFY